MSKTTKTEAFEALTSILPSRSADENYWWDLTGPQLAALVEGAGYAPAKQYEALLFHYHWMVPYMGPAPWAPSIDLKWKSLLQPDGTPIEYSWKWNTTTSEPDIRYDIEPINNFSGTQHDPLNQSASREMLHRLDVKMPSVDLQWANHYFNTLYDHDNAKYNEEHKSGKKAFGTIVIAAEFLPKGLRFKTYYLPRKLGQGATPNLSVFTSSARLIDPDSRAISALEEFLSTSEEGKLLKPFSVAIDNVVPEKSRLKWYFNSPHTNFKALNEVMTLGGRIKRPKLEGQLTALQDLLRGVLSLPDDYPEDQELPNAGQNNRVAAGEDVNDTAPPLLPGFVYYFDVAPGYQLPEVKLALPLITFAQNDASVAKNTVAWMEARGRGAYAKSFMTMLEKLAKGKDLAKGKGLQSFISVLLKEDGDLDVTTYFAPQALALVEEETNGGH
ncbi:4-O-dimethylallyl-L-tyrosine synthase [Cercospora beticola]|uniref:4-O-dimethylallyl-L-tyrosine synthase n=1 Tax=Cercospora beticola TaxID=122368 RepID=A0A2G5I437_CERBT|nr:4-O-dimethylallyl-L-tyrosine synthase [Cercospora beticola]PIA99511.1 4-O-dimethylallyl-L-tyrosine synthase [Cercospora beticola]WPA99480.1 hypothetical protein RHO25_004097 [Cercospora beticola]